MIIYSSKLDTIAKVIAVYGGTAWVKIEGKFLLGQSSSYAINTTGGEAMHTLTVAEMPSHNHSITDPGHSHSFNSIQRNSSSTDGAQGGDKGYPTEGRTTASSTTGISINSNGSGGAHNNMPPYKVVYIWERTA